MKKQIFKLTLASSFTAIAVIIDIIFKSFLPSNFGIPMYAIPVIVGSIILGPFYGGIIGFASDVLGFYAMPQDTSFNIIFSISAIAWGIIPGLFISEKSQKIVYGIVLFFSHLIATLLNSLALFIVVGKKVALASLPIRLSFLPLNVLVLSVLCFVIVNRLSNKQLDIPL